MDKLPILMFLLCCVMFFIPLYLLVSKIREQLPQGARIQLIIVCVTAFVALLIALAQVTGHA